MTNHQPAIVLNFSPRNITIIRGLLSFWVTHHVTSPQILYFLTVKAKTMLLLLKCSLRLISYLCWCPGGRVWRLYGRGWCDRSVSPAHHDCRCSVSSEDTGPQPDPVHCCSAANSHTDTDTSTGHNHSPDMHHYIISLKNSKI